MSSFISLAISILLLASGVFAQQVMDYGAYKCPGYFDVYVPPGENDAVSVCCAGAKSQTLAISNCPGWPICSGSATTTASFSPLACATVITYQSGGDNSDYCSAVSEARDSLSASGTHIVTTLPVGSGTVGVTLSVPGGSSAAASASASLSASGSNSASAPASSSASATQSSSSSGSTVLVAQLGFIAIGLLALAIVL